MGYIQGPMLLSISGFLLRKKDFLDLNFIELIKKYFFRLYIPYLIAWSIYFIYYYHELIFTFNITFEFILSSFILPEAHLWFIPTLIFFIFITWFIKRIKISDYIIFFAIIAFTILLVFFINSKIIDNYKFYSNIIHKYRPEYYIFFFLGYFLRNREINVKIRKNIKFIGLLIPPLFLLRFYFLLITEQFISFDFFVLTIIIISPKFWIFFSLYYFTKILDKIIL